MNKKIMIGAIIVLVIVLGALFMTGSDSTIENNDAENKTITSNATTVLSEIITREALSLHNKQEDCWVVYKGKVYDLTEFLPKHPGSARAIAPHCGTADQFEAAFTRKHGTSKANMLMQVGRFMGDFEVKGELQ